MAASSPPPDRSQDVERRISLLFAVMVTAFVLLFARAYDLQVRHGDQYLALSERNRIRTVALPAPRGSIYDRRGTLLVNNAPSFNLYAVPGDLRDLETVLTPLAALTGIAPDTLRMRLTSQAGDRYAQVLIKRNLSFKEVAWLEGRRTSMHGVHVEVEFKRNAIYGAMASHLLGYVGEITETQFASGRFPEVAPGALIGQYGVEQTYDTILRGLPGEKLIEVDAAGNEQKALSRHEATSGSDVYLTLDVALQNAAEQALGEEVGAIVALDPHNGDVLAIVSHPAFDPNALSVGISPQHWKALLTDTARPLINRTIQGLYPPGSTYKIVMSAALLETQKASVSETVHCPGFFPFGGRDFRDWKKTGHGHVALHRALVESCDVYFYRMGMRLPIDTIARFSHLLGLGQATGIVLGTEAKGLIPSTKWKRQVRKEPWYPGETLSVAIGQGYVLVTPLQMATMIGAVASGVWHSPQLLLKYRDRFTGETLDMPRNPGRMLSFSDETWRVIRNALVGVVAEPQGTAGAGRSMTTSIAGKTGTAQVVIRNDEPRRKLSKAFDDHAWFVAYAPSEQPKIAVAVLIEHGGHGGSAAAPRAKQVIEAFLHPKSLAPRSPEG